jgi:hypothetical protein
MRSKSLHPLCIDRLSKYQVNKDELPSHLSVSLGDEWRFHCDRTPTYQVFYVYRSLGMVAVTELAGDSIYSQSCHRFAHLDSRDYVTALLRSKALVTALSGRHGYRCIDELQLQNFPRYYCR